MRPMRPFMTEALEAIADRFHPREGIKAIRSLGSGNVNETFLVTHEGQDGAFVARRQLGDQAADLRRADVENGHHDGAAPRQGPHARQIQVGPGLLHVLCPRADAT